MPLIKESRYPCALDNPGTLNQNNQGITYALNNPGIPSAHNNPDNPGALNKIIQVSHTLNTDLVQPLLR